VKRAKKVDERGSKTDIQRHLEPLPQRSYDLDKSWKAVSSFASEDPDAFKLCSLRNVVTGLESSNGVLDRI
jgi:hypothetical protein